MVRFLLETDGGGENRIGEAVSQGARDGMDHVDLWIEYDQRHIRMNMP